MFSCVAFVVFRASAPDPSPSGRRWPREARTDEGAAATD
jgi:hypothetical protein